MLLWQPHTVTEHEQILNSKNKFSYYVVGKVLLIPCLGTLQGLEEGLEHGRMVSDLNVLTIFSCDWHLMGKVIPQLFCHAEASYGKTIAFLSISCTLRCCWGWIIWASSPGCINSVGMAKQSTWICFAAAVSTFNVAQTSWLSCLYWHLRDALAAVLIPKGTVWTWNYH